MLSTPDKLRDERRSYSVIYLEIIRMHAREPGSLLCVVEGKDTSFFLPRIEQWKVHRAISERAYFFDANGRDSVLEVRRSVESNKSLNDSFCLYFIDRDFRVGLADGRLDTFVTEGYSVEYYYFGQEFVRRVIECQIYQNQIDAARRQILDAILITYSVLEDKYLETATEFNSWVMAQRGAVRRRIPLREFDKMKYLEVCFSTPEAALNISNNDLNALPDADAHPSTEEISAARDALSQRDKRITFRAKQHALFVMSFIRALLDEVQQGLFDIGVEDPGGVQISPKRFLHDFSAFADTPVALISFLNNYYEARLEA